MKRKATFTSILLIFILSACSKQTEIIDFKTTAETETQSLEITSKESETTPAGTQEVQTFEFEFDYLPAHDRLRDLEYDYFGNVSISGDVLTIKPKEYIAYTDITRIEELGLTEDDMVSGYYILDTNQPSISFKIVEETEFHFLDWGRDFGGTDSNIFLVTRDKDLFIQYLATYSDGGAKQPFFLIVENGVLKHLIEIFMA